MYYAGIDAHAQYLQVAVVDKSGTVRAEGPVPVKQPEKLLDLLEPFEPVQVVMETSGFWPWIRDLLQHHRAATFHLAHARELRAIAEHAQKNDQVDALLLARMLLAGLIPPAYAYSSEELDALRLVRHHAWLVRNRSQLANRIHAQLHQSGMQLPREKLLRRESRHWLKTFAWDLLTPEQRGLVQTHFFLIDRIEPVLRVVRRRIRRRASESPTALLLQSVTGIGPYWSLLLAAEIGPIRRFPNASCLVSYAGLAPITRSSGGHTHHGPLPKAANRWVRGALVAATMTHVHRAPDSPLTRYYLQTKERLGWKKARVAAARRLTRIIYAMLREQRPWRTE